MTWFFICEWNMSGLRDFLDAVFQDIINIKPKFVYRVSFVVG